MKFFYVENISHTFGGSFIGWRDLISRVSNPPYIATTNVEEAKKKSNAITASNANSKQLKVIQEHDNFTLLRLDLDDTQHTIESISKILKPLEVNSFLVHTTINHQRKGKGNRFRIYIELSHGIALLEWCIVQTYLAYIFGADDCSNRPQQVMFLPVRLAGGVYSYHINTGKALNIYASSLFLLAMQFDVSQKKKTQLLEQEKANQVKPAYKEKLITGQVSIIEAVNQGYDWPHLLSLYGYKRQGQAWLAPESTSKIAGVYILKGNDGKERYYSHHSSDPCAIGKCLDKFDFLAIRIFNGNYFNAVRSLAKHFPEHDQYNKQQYTRYQQAVELQRIKEGL